MASRVTQGMMSIQLLRNLNTNMTKMNTLQNQLSSGRRINKPSDDPVGISFSMRYRSEHSANDQYVSNTNAAISFMDYTDTTLNQAGNVLQRVRELAVQGANGTNSDLALDTIKAEILQLKEQMMTIANSQFNGKYVFNGQMTDKPAYTTDDPGTESTDDGQIRFEIGAGITISVNVTGNQIFGSGTDPDNAFRVFDELSAALDVSDFAEVSNLITKVDSRMDTFLELRADVGAKMNRLDLSNDRLGDISINLQSLLSKTEDADMAVVITNQKMAENVYQASLASGSKLIMPSLLDYLR
jgi:flagellar hook-associated protein 3 FlgL